MAFVDSARFDDASIADLKPITIGVVTVADITPPARAILDPTDDILDAKSFENVPDFFDASSIPLL
jgi:hypothetical protein